MKRRLRYSNHIIWFLSTSIGFTNLVCADITEEPKEGLYFSYGKLTIKDKDKFPDFLNKRIAFDSQTLKIEKILGEVCLMPENGPLIPINLYGFTIHSGDHLKTSATSRATIKISADILLTLGEKTNVRMFVKNNKTYFKVIEGNARVESKDNAASSNYFLETPEFISEINRGDCFVSVSKTEGSSFFVLTGRYLVISNEDLLTSFTLDQGSMVNKLKNVEAKKSFINAVHKNFATNELSFNYETSKSSTNVKEIYDHILNAPQGILTRLSLNNLDEKERAQIFEDVTKHLYASGETYIFSRHEAQAIARLVVDTGKNLKAAAKEASVKSKEKLSRDDYLQELQQQMQQKANQLKEEEDRLLREAQEAEAKIKSKK